MPGRRTIAVVLGVVIFVVVGGGLLAGLVPDGTGTGSDDGTGSDTDTPPGDDPTVDLLPGFDPPDPATVPGALDADHGTFADFEDVTDIAGLEYDVPEGIDRFIAQHGPHVVDFDNDGYEDLLLVGGDRPVLFENTGGAYDAVREFDHENVQTAHFFDYDNDGYRDLLFALRGESPVFYENVDGEFQHRPVGFTAQMDYPTTITSADFTGNGCLDVYIGDWSSTSGFQLSTDEAVTVANTHPDPRLYGDNGAPNRLFAGDCQQFEEIAVEAGVAGTDHTLAVSAADFTGNGHVDIHAGNDFGADFVYENQGDGTFEAVDLGPNSDRNAMSSVAVDMTGSHRLDLFVTNVYFAEYDVEQVVPLTLTPLPHGNNLFVNDGNGQFRDVAPDHGLEKGSWGWAATVADYTNDGHLDVIHGVSYLDIRGIQNHSDINRPPQVWKGTADSWEKIDGFEVGFAEHNIRGVARVDYQNDGTLDFVTVGNPSQRDLPGVVTGANRAFLYENTLESEDSLQLWVRNPDGLERNAGVYVETDQRTIYREANARGDLLSQDSRLIHVGTAHETVERVVVEWPDGTTTAYSDLSEGSRYVLTPDDASPVE